MMVGTVVLMRTLIIVQLAHASTNGLVALALFPPLLGMVFAMMKLTMMHAIMMVGTVALT